MHGCVSVFVGRSLGATMALVEAARFKPRGLLADGLGAGLSAVIRSWTNRHGLLLGWELLPIRSLVGTRDFSTPRLMEQMRSVPAWVFQGTADDVTPYALVQDVPLGHPNVHLIPVENASHENAYLLAGDAYIEKLRLMLGQ